MFGRTCILRGFVIYCRYRAEDLESYQKNMFYDVIVDVISIAIQLIIMYYTIKMYHKD